MRRKPLYLALFVAGAVAPMWAFLPWVATHGLDGRLFVRELFANRVSTFFALDLLLTAVCVIYLALLRRGRGRLWWLPIAATCLVGVSAGLPLLLYLRDGATSEA